MIVSRSNVRLGLTGALLLMLLGVFQGCGAEPTGPTAQGGGDCVWIDGQIFCD